MTDFPNYPPSDGSTPNGGAAPPAPPANPFGWPAAADVSQQQNVPPSNPLPVAPEGPAYGASGGHNDPNFAPPGAGPAPGYPNTGYPSSGYPPSQPPPGYPPGYPPQSSAPPGYPGAGYPPGYPPQTYAPGGYPGTPYPAQLPNESLAIPAMVLGLVGIMCGITAPVGLIMGIISLSRINRSANTLGGRGMAITGIVVGGIITALMVIYLIFVVAVLRSSTSY